MYLYFDKSGLLKEQINDASIRQGNIGVNKIYVYYEEPITPSLITARYRDGNGNLNATQFNVSTTTVTAKIPYNRFRDLKFFKYNVDYNFYVFDIPSEILQIAGATGCTIRLTPNDENSDITLSTFTFMIEESVEGDNYVASDEYVSLAQFQYLLNLVTHKSIDFKVFNESQEYFFTKSYVLKPMYMQEGAGEISYIREVDNYDSSKTYNEGDKAFYDNIVYICQEDNVTGIFNENKWEATNEINRYLGVNFTFTGTEDDETLVVFYFRG